MAGSSRHWMELTVSRWNLFPLPQFTSSRLGRPQQRSSKPWVTRSPAAVKTLPPPVMRPQHSRGRGVAVVFGVLSGFGVRPGRLVGVAVGLAVGVGLVERGG